MTGEEVQRKLAEFRDELLKLRLRKGTEQLTNPLRLRYLRRDIARCLTVLRAGETKGPVAAEKK
jgi:large subunit ribosomal protein L29